MLFLLLTLALETLRCDQSLDLRGFGVWLLAFLLDLSANDEFANIILLAQVEQLSDVVGTLGTQATRASGIYQLLMKQRKMFQLLLEHTCETSDVLLAFLNNNARDNAHVGVDDATTSALLFALTLAAWSVAR